MNQKIILATLILLFLISGIGGWLMLKKEIAKILQRRIQPNYKKEVFTLPEELQSKPSPAPTAKTFKLPIIMYHYVEYVKDEGDTIRKSLDVNPGLFEQQLKGLVNSHYQTYFVGDIPAILDEKIPLSSRSAVLTFDDGYEDFYTDAFPILKKYNIKATIYIINNFIGRPGFMNQGQIQKVLDSGLVQLGCHTLDHFYLKKAGKNVATREILVSKFRLENLFHVPVLTFAYPYGAFDGQAIDIVREASFSAAVSVIPGTKQSQNNLFYLSRIRAGGLDGANIDYILQHWKN
jgi:peptidoglycan/xylan/chitin deacetylase (PgdA/CDA1 family)